MKMPEHFFLSFLINTDILLPQISYCHRFLASRAHKCILQIICNKLCWQAKNKLKSLKSIFRKHQKRVFILNHSVTRS